MAVQRVLRLARRAPIGSLNIFCASSPNISTKIDPEFGIDEMTLVAATAEPMTADQSNLQRGATAQSTDSYNAVIDRLTNRLGSRNVRRTHFRESHIPERAAGFIPIGKIHPIQTDQRDTDTPRPLRLLRPAEQVEAVAESTDGPPVLFRWRRVLHHITSYEGPERVAPEWWRSDTENPRDYYRVENETGQRFWLYRNSETSWFLHGGIWMTPYAELQTTSNFSFLRGAAHPEELVARAAERNLNAIAITDRNTLAGVVRAHLAARETAIKLIVGARLDFTDAPSLICLPMNREAYGRLSQLITLGRRRAPKR